MKRKSLLFTLVMFSFLLLPTSGWTQSEQSTTNQQRRLEAQEFREQLIAERKAALTEARSQRIIARCEMMKGKIDQIISRLLTVKDARGNLISAMVNKLENFSDRLQAANLDTAALDEDIATLGTMSGELDTIWADFQTKLEELKNTECDEDSKPFHEALELAKEAMAEVRAKYREIKDFLQSEVKVELQNLREQLGDDANAAEDSADGETEDGDATNQDAQE